VIATLAGASARAQTSPEEEAQRARLAQAELKHQAWEAQPPDAAQFQPSGNPAPQEDPQVQAARILAEAKIRAAQIQALGASGPKDHNDGRRIRAR
jgi:hypothetical protein